MRVEERSVSKLVERWSWR